MLPSKSRTGGKQARVKQDLYLLADIFKLVNKVSGRCSAVYSLFCAGEVLGAI